MSSETIYIVSGFMRTGTSMMMNALHQGGMDAIAREGRDQMRLQHTDEFYDPNEGGLYEIESKDAKDPNFPAQFKGKLIKVLNAGTTHLDVMQRIKVVYMRRDYEEVRQSYQAFFDSAFGGNEEKYLENVERNIRLLGNRKDVDLIVLWYRDVVQNPTKAFTLLKKGGWPIDIQKAVAVVRPELCRFRHEELEVGII